MLGRAFRSMLRARFKSLKTRPLSGLKAMSLPYRSSHEATLSRNRSRSSLVLMSKTFKKRSLSSLASWRRGLCLSQTSPCLWTWTKQRCRKASGQISLSTLRTAGLPSVVKLKGLRPRSFKRYKEGLKLPGRALADTEAAGDYLMSLCIHHAYYGRGAVEKAAIEHDVPVCFQRAAAVNRHLGEPVMDDPSEPVGAMAALPGQLPDRVALTNPALKPDPLVASSDLLVAPAIGAPAATAQPTLLSIGITAVLLDRFTLTSGAAFFWSY